MRNPFLVGAPLASMAVSLAVISLLQAPRSNNGPNHGPGNESLVSSFVGAGRIGATGIDCSGLDQALEDGSPQNRFGGVSAIDHIPGTDRYVVLSDRGPKDGAVNYLCRFHVLTISIRPMSGQPVEASIDETVILRDESGRPFPGNSNAIDASEMLATRLDPEGIRMDWSGNLILSDEYGPSIMKVSSDGKLLESFPVPRSFQISSPSPDSKIEDGMNFAGRRSNRGMEGLALSPDGTSLTGLMQSPLLQDMVQNVEGKRVGINTRMLQVDIRTGRQQQFVYQLENPNHKLHEILAVDSGRYLVIEQDGLGGELARFKKIVLIETSGATALPEEIALPADHLPDEIQPVRKVRTLDLLDPSFGLAGPDMPEKIEGICFGPSLADGRRILIVATDNDFRPDQDTMFYVFAVSL